MAALEHLPANEPGLRPAGITVTCEHCGRERYYRPSEIGKSAPRYCSKVCKYASEAVFITCHQCGEVKRRSPSFAAVKTGKYGDGFCCLACWHAYNRGAQAARFNSVERICAGCGVVMLRPPSQVSATGVYTCSYECVGKVRRGKTSPLRQPRETVKCACGKTFEARPAFGNRTGHQKERQKFCSRDCASEAMRIASDYVYGPDWARARRRALKRDNGTCQDCGSTTRVEVHHLHAKRNGGSNALSNLRTLCRSCHKRADAALAAEDRLQSRQLSLIPRRRRRKEALSV